MRKQIALAMMGLCVLPFRVMAQDAAPADNNGKAEAGKYADKRVTLTFEGVSMTTAIQTLMKTVGADFLIDPGLKDSVVNAKLNNVRFPVALDVLLKSGSIPAEFTVKDGIFRFTPRKEPIAPPQEEPPAPPDKEPFLPFISRIPIKNMEAARMYALLTGTPYWGGIPDGMISGDVTGHQEGSGFGFNNGSASFGNWGSNLYRMPPAINYINNAANFTGSFSGLLNGLLNSGNRGRR
jgi:hypothetical protein